MRGVFAGSSVLAKQIENGAPADIYFSANPAWMDYLAALGHIDTATRRDLLANRLVVIAPAESPSNGAFDVQADIVAALGDQRRAVRIAQLYAVDSLGFEYKEMAGGLFLST